MTGPTRHAAAAMLIAAVVAPAFAQRVITRRGDTVITRETKDTRPDPEAVRAGMRRRCIEHLDEAEDHHKAGAHAPACASLRKAKVVLVDKDLAERYARIARELNATGEARMQLADDAYRKGDYAAALREYRRIMIAFHPLPVSRRARQARSAAESDPAVAAALAEDRAAAMFEHVERTISLAQRAAATRPAATTRPATAPAEVQIDLTMIEALADEPFLEVVRALETIVKTAAETPTGKRAAGLLGEMRGDPACKKRLDRTREDERARQALAKANAYEKAGMLRKSAELYEQVIEDFPRTDHAREAAARLGTVQGTLDAR